MNEKQQADKKAVGSRIHDIRNKLGMTLEEFGTKAGGATKSNVIKWENGTTLPRNERLLKISSLGNISFSHLLWGSLEDYLNEYMKGKMDKTLKDFLKLNDSEYLTLKNNVINTAIKMVHSEDNSDPRGSYTKTHKLLDEALKTSFLGENFTADGTINVALNGLKSTEKRVLNHVNKIDHLEEKERDLNTLRAVKEAENEINKIVSSAKQSLEQLKNKYKI